MKVETTRFGRIEVEDTSVIELPLGLLGFEQFHKYCLVQPDPDTPFKWLQSVESPELAFIVADPMQFFEDYEVEVQDTEASFLNIQEPDDAVVMTLVTVGAETREITTNLLGPIVINAKTLVGMQVVLQNENYSTKHKIGVLNASRDADERPLIKAA